MAYYSRRDFIRTTAAAGLGIYASTIFGCGKKAAAELGPRVLRPNGLSEKLAVAKGGGIEQMVRATMKAIGGMEKVVKSGDTVVVKPNIGWASRPEYGACSHPETVAAVVKLCIEAGAAKVKVFDNPCEDRARTYNESGIRKAAETAGAEVPYMDNSRFVDLEIPGAEALREWPTYRDALECDVLINVPVPKHHGSAGLTLSLKNMMGVAGGNRGKWHQNLDTKIADFYSAAPCDLTVVDAQRIMLRSGPNAGRLEDIETKNTIAVCKDAVAADAYAARELFGRKPEQILYVKKAHDRSLGDMDYASRLLNVAV